MFLDCLNGGLSLSVLVIPTFSFAILYIMTRQASLRLSSILSQLKCCNISPTLDVFRCLLLTNLADLSWTSSNC